LSQLLERYEEIQALVRASAKAPASRAKRGPAVKRTRVEAETPSGPAASSEGPSGPQGIGTQQVWEPAQAAAVSS